MGVMSLSPFILIFNAESTGLKIMEIGGGADLPIFFFFWHPGLHVIFFNLSKAQIAPAIENGAVRNTQRLDEFFGVSINFFVEFYALLVIGLAQNNLFNFIKFMNSNQALHVPAMTAGFSPETGRKSEITNRQTFRLQNFSSMG